MNDIDVEILPDGASLAARAADLVAARLELAVGARRWATLAVSGGSTPAAFLEALADRKLSWEHVHLFQVDERVAPPGAERNLTGLREALLDRAPIPASNVHPMPVDEPDLAAAAADYSDQIRKITGPKGRFDVVHLGLGDDGHTASWPPDDPVVDTKDDIAVTVPFNGRVRMTLTPWPVNRANRIVWLIAGASKAPVVARLLAGDPAIPASRIRRHGVALLADADAGAGLLSG